MVKVEDTPITHIAVMSTVWFVLLTCIAVPRPVELVELAYRVWITRIIHRVHDTHIVWIDICLRIDCHHVIIFIIFIIFCICYTIKGCILPLWILLCLLYHLLPLLRLWRWLIEHRIERGCVIVHIINCNIVIIHHITSNKVASGVTVKGTMWM